MLRSAFAALIVLSSALPSATSEAAEPARVAVPGQARDAYRPVLRDIRNYDAGFEPFCITEASPVNNDGVYGLKLGFSSTLPGFQRIEFSEGNGEFKVLERNDLLVQFDPNAEIAQDRTYQFRPVTDRGPVRTYTVKLNCMTRRAFATSGGKRNKDIVKITFDPHIPFGAANPSRWRTTHPNRAEIEFATKQWGELVAQGKTDLEKAQILTKALMRELKGTGGLPSAFIYNLRAFEKYKAITAGKSKHACAQYSEIFSMACSCFGIINRWGFIHDDLQSDEMLIELGSSHLLTEIFDSSLNQWVFLDGRMSTLAAYLGEIGPLSLQEFFLLFNQPNRRNHLNVVVYDPGTNAERRVPIAQSPSAYLAYQGWTKGYHIEYDKAPSQP